MTDAIVATAGAAALDRDRLSALASWPAAANLPERSASPVTATGDPARTRRRVRRWRDAVGRGADESLQPLLAAIGLTEQTLEALLGEPEPALRARLETASAGDQPDWLRDIAGVGRDADPLELPQADDLALMRFVIPLIAAFATELVGRVDALLPEAGQGADLGELSGLLAGGWPRDDLAMALGRTLVLELNVARLEGRLTGDDPDERYRAFCASLCEPEAALAFWEEYPVLLRYVRDVLRGWVETRVEFATRLLADLEELRGQFEGVLGRLTSVRFGAGDRHRGGRSVAIVGFEGGTAVYKPRSLAAEAAWQTVLAWANRRAAPYGLKRFWVLDRADYGWTEFVAAATCASREQADAFYWRLGALLGLQYALRGVDIHAENLIAAGEHPVLVDLEAVFHPDAPDKVAVPWEGPADALIGTGVTAVGLLPMKMLSREDGRLRALDLSVVGMVDGQESPYPLAVVSQAGTDEMRFVEERIVLPRVGDSRVRVDGSDVDPRAHVDPLCAGLEWVYRQILADRPAWTAAGGLVDGFAHVPLRYIARPTMFYGRLLMDSTHPDFGRDYLERCRVLLRLAVNADGSFAWERLVRHELADLNGGDVPYFEYRPATRHVWDSRGEQISDFLPEAPLDVVRSRVDGLDEADLAVQVRLARHAIASLASGITAVLEAGTAVSIPAVPDDDAARAAASAIAVRLATQAVRDETEVGWLSVNLVDELHWQADSASIDLYAGIAGIGLFLATAVRAAGDAGDRIDPIVREIADRAADTVCRRLDAVTDHLRTVSADTGRLNERLLNQADSGAFGLLGGPIVFLAHAAGRLDRPDLADRAEDALEALATYIDHDRYYDLMSGSAGAILAALTLHAVRPEGRSLSLAERAAAVLVNAATAQNEGIGWLTGLSNRALVGLSHGVSGPVLALSRLHAIAPRPEYARTVTEALRYERSTFDEARGNWPDLRDERIGGSGDFMTTWCHGAPGIGLVRFELLRRGHGSLHPQGEAGVREELGWALAETRRAFQLPVDGRGDATANDAYLLGCDAPCHGDLGNLELLLVDALDRGDGGTVSLVRRMVAAAVGRARDSAWRTGVAGIEDTPSLMFGLSGIGYQLLRLTAPHDVPSILLLEPPAEHQR